MYNAFLYFRYPQNRKSSKDSSWDKRAFFNQGGQGSRRNNGKQNRPHSASHYSKDAHSSVRSTSPQWSQKWNQSEQFSGFYRAPGTVPRNAEPTVAFFHGNPILAGFTPPSQPPMSFSGFQTPMTFYPQLNMPNFSIPPPPLPSANPPPPPPPIPSPRLPVTSSWSASATTLQSAPLPSTVSLPPPPPGQPSSGYVTVLLL